MIDSAEQSVAVNKKPKRPFRLLPERWGTTLKSHFFREKNLVAIAEQIIKKERGLNGIRILSVGCSIGLEAQELALRLLSNGVTDFQIDGIDISDIALTLAQRNELKVGHYGDRKQDDFFKTMAAKGLIILNGKAVDLDDPVWKNSATSDTFNLSDEVSSRLNFKKHDIVNGPLPAGAQYDVVICNNVLIHYSKWERDLILTHSLGNLKDEGIFAREDSVWASIDNSQSERDWVSKYFEWINKSFPRFGLKPEEIKLPGDDNPVTLWKYRRSENKHLPNNFKAKFARVANATLLQLNRFKRSEFTS